MKRARLPLTALRSFEAAGRLQSFTAAAQELFVSQAAISRQVRELEDALGTALFVRQHRKVALTRDGAKLLAVLTQSFDAIEDSLRDMRARPGSAEVTISVEPSFASCWLVSHLADFRRLHPEIDVNLDADPRLVDFRAHPAEIAIRFSATATGWPRTRAVRLCDTRVTPVVARSSLEAGPALETPKDLLDWPLLHEENRQLWEQWLAAAGVTRGDLDRGSVFPDGGLVMNAVLGGQGAAIMDLTLASDRLADGTLVRPFQLTLDYGGYWLVSREGARLSEPAALFADWLRSCFA
ncbi:MAG: LysR substrate-binding domain-containing protein [Oricola sp.]